MSNHCDNYLALCGEDIKSLKAFHKAMGNEMDFNKVIPMPQALCDQGNLSPVDREGPNWYDWACIHWGTKWNAYDNNPELTSAKYPENKGDCGEVCYNFLTAWGPPTPIVRELQRQYPTLCITMYFSIDCAEDGWVDENGNEVYAKTKQENGRLIFPFLQGL
jgi:hypothetical protein|tara:strand:- start:239 stop:724 length:486 start_codon:yes stop_codon:yes gene_type:complete